MPARNLLKALAPIAGTALTAAILAAGATTWLAGPQATASHVAQQPSRATRVATVNLETLLDGLDEQDVLQKQLDVLVAEGQDQIKALQEELERLDGDRQALVQGSQEYRKKQLEMRETQIQIRARAESLQALIADETGTVLLQVFKKIRASTAIVAQRDGWDVVVVDDSSATIPDQGAQQFALNYITNRTLLYSADAVDITDDVRQYMNNRFNAGN